MQRSFGKGNEAVLMYALHVMHVRSYLEFLMFILTSCYFFLLENFVCNKEILKRLILAQHDLVNAQRQTQAKLDALLTQQTNAKTATKHVEVPNFIKV